MQQNVQHLLGSRLCIIDPSGKYSRTQQLIDRPKHAMSHHAIGDIRPEDPLLLPAPHHLPNQLDIPHQMIDAKILQ